MEEPKATAYSALAGNVSSNKTTVGAAGWPAGAGVGGGTFLVFLAREVVTDPTLQSLLIYISPSVSIVVGLVWYWIRKEIDNRQRRRRITSALERIRQLLAEFENDPQIPRSELDRIRQKYHMLAVLLADLEVGIALEAFSDTGAIPNAGSST